ncbi:GNAT family N-acetyltransferase [Castellaniella daejeonensis]|jgi:predicted GNAT family acetyltransferase|uniref:GNAT family N-acetyltransferase n=1 Tax=Castellaniella daejeonensis TaxID=659013 RepID=A0ABN0TJ02_9BURK|nr:GNAT family N-acetyltransferase [Castellaniella sp.]HET8703994.1 GNAT family N-acetyltransferase [Castellaniella sp.]
MSSESRAAARPTRAVRHDEAAHRFEWTEDGHFCVLDYTLDGKVASFTHTGVPSAVGGRGIAADLVRTGLDTARARGWRIRPLCSYVAAFIRRHPEYQDLVD